MPITVGERQDSFRKSGTSIEREFWVRGTNDVDAARAALLASGSVPETIGTFTRQDKEAGVEEAGLNAWLGTVVWKTPDASNEPNEPDIDGFSLSVDISGTTTRITQAYFHVGHYAPPGKTAYDFYGQIGVTGNSVDGVDVITPQMSFTASYQILDDDLPDDYFRNTVPTIVGAQNNDTFLDYEAGELLLTKVNANKKYDPAANDNVGAYVWDVSFGFSVSRNQEDFEIVTADGTITIPMKKGWDVLWTYKQERQLETGDLKYTAPVVVSAYVEQVYPDAAFGDLVVTP